MTLRFKTYLFDLDGTLLDTLPDFVAVTNRTLSQEGYRTYTMDEMVRLFGGGLLEFIRKALPLGTPEEEIRRVYQLWNKNFHEHGLETTTPYPQVRETLEALKREGAQLGVVSNKIDSHTQSTIQQIFPGVFQAVHGECAEFPRKPDPTSLLRTMEELGAQAETTVYVGDSAGDMQAARAAKLFAVAVDYGYGENGGAGRKSADAVITGFEQLLSL